MKKIILFLFAAFVSVGVGAATDRAPVLRSTPSGLEIADLATGGSGTETDPWTGWAARIPAGIIAEHLRAGWFQAEAAPAGWAVDGIAILGDGAFLTYLRFTGPGDAFVIINPTYLGDLHVRVENLAVQGVPGTTNVFHFKNTHRSSFRNLRAVGTFSAAALLIEGSVGGTVEGFAVGKHEGGMISFGENGIRITGGATTLTIINPRIDHLHGAGILGESGMGIVIVGGYAEQCGIGLETRPDTQRWKIDGFDTEQTVGDSKLIAGVSHVISGGQTIGRLRLPAGAVGVLVAGGGHDIIDVEAGAVGTTLLAVSVNLTGSGYLADAGLGTRRLGARDQARGVEIP